MAGKVGFIGLGAMGGPMALNLVKHGFSLVVHDLDPARREPLGGRPGRAQGLNKEDGSAIIKVFEQLAGVKIGEGE